MRRILLDLRCSVKESAERNQPTLVKIFENDPSAEVRADVIFWINDTRRVKEAVLNDPSEKVRIAALATLGEFEEHIGFVPEQTADAGFTLSSRPVCSDGV